MVLTTLALGLALLAAASPCSGLGSSSDSGGASVSSVVTEAFFDGIRSHARDGCEGKNFYTRSAFVSAAGAFPGFAHGGTEAEGKREIAAFFAHVTFERPDVNFCYINQLNGKGQVSCDPSVKQWPCAPGKQYYGRGPLQISWNFNYGPAGQSIGFDALGDPDRVAQDPVISFKTALWLWMKNAHQVVPQGFGATIRALHGALECYGNSPATVNARVGYYKEYCKQFGVGPRNNITC